MIAGGCRCGAVRYTIARDDLPRSYACHCHVCQRWTGSAFSQSVIVAESTLAVDGPIVVYEHVTEDRVSTQRVCGTCHARIYNTNTRRPGYAVVRAGTLDRSEELVCVAHIFTAYRQRWVTIPADVPSWAEAPEPDTFGRLLAGQTAAR
ncbi:MULTISPECIES: GFA family protein [Sphingomonas]|uniref:GFA family protein n=1 Tax=Sphingomonas TaxID=13687 RepID=UPI00193B9FCB|nr:MULTISPECIES: GFA family protein [Sphingomonas]